MKPPVPEIVPLDGMLLTMLRTFHAGRDNAIKQKYLQGKLSEGIYEPSLRELRASHERLVANGYPVGVNHNGYFYEVTPADRRATRHYRMKKIIALLRSEKRARFAFEAELQRQCMGQIGEQVEMDIENRGPNPCCRCVMVEAA